MDSLHNQPRPLPTPSSPLAETNQLGILLSRDLIFTTKVKGTAAELGYQVLVAGDPSQAKRLIEARQPRSYLRRSNRRRARDGAELDCLPRARAPGAWFVAFGPHVEADTLAMAKDVGCQVVMPRSKFAAELPDLIHRYFDGTMNNVLKP